MSWKALEQGRPELAAFGSERFRRFSVAYLATVRADGSPRVHPVTPIIAAGRLFLFMEPTSPKGHDLRRDGRYALHCAVSDSSGESGEFFISGRARFTDDATDRERAIQASTYKPAERYILFELHVEQAASTVYADSQIVRQRWKAGEA
jgi:hypothetical protein